MGCPTFPRNVHKTSQESCEQVQNDKILVFCDLMSTLKWLSTHGGPPLKARGYPAAQIMFLALTPIFGIFCEKRHFFLIWPKSFLFFRFRRPKRVILTQLDEIWGVNVRNISKKVKNWSPITKMTKKIFFGIFFIFFKKSPKIFFLHFQNWGPKNDFFSMYAWC